jgi:enoyl-CoA hydratase
MDAGLAYESLTVRSADHREAVQAMLEKRKPVFGQAAGEGVRPGRGE